jgi:hypothetical protein
MILKIVQMLSYMAVLEVVPRGKEILLRDGIILTLGVLREVREQYQAQEPLSREWLWRL